MWSRRKNNRALENAADTAKADRAERFEIYKLMVEMADRVSQRRQAANSFYLSINTFLITASAYLGATEIPVRLTAFVCFAGVMVSLLWITAIRSYKSLNENKFLIINALEIKLAAQPYTDEWAKINPAINGKKHRPFHQTEKVVPKIFICLFLAELVSILPVRAIINYLLLLIGGCKI